MKRKENIRKTEAGSRKTEARKGQRAEGKAQKAGIKDQGSRIKNPVSPSDRVIRADSNQKQVTNKISTVLHIKKPSANGFFIPAEGCISGSRAIRACLTIRVFNN